MNNIRYDVIEIIEVERRGVVDRDYETYRENLTGVQAERVVEELGSAAWTYQVAERYWDSDYSEWSTCDPIPADEWLYERDAMREEAENILEEYDATRRQ